MFQDRLQAEKGKEEESHPQRTLKGLRDRPAALTRFDDNVLSKEQQELEEQLSKSQEMRSKWKKAIDKTKHEVGQSVRLSVYCRQRQLLV